MLETHSLTQNVQIKVYESAADLPGWWETFFTGLVKALPWIGLIIGLVILGVLAYFAYRRLMAAYRHTEKFWEKFAAIHGVLFLAVAGVIYVNFNAAKVYFEQKNLEIVVIKDQNLTVSVDDRLYVKTGWQNGHDVSLAMPQQVARVVEPNTAYAAPAEQGGGIKLSLRLPDGSLIDKIPSQLAFINANPSKQTKPDNYQLVAMVPADTIPGTYTVDIDWETSQRDSLMSVATAQKRLDTSKDNKMITERLWEQGNEDPEAYSDMSYYNAIGSYLEPDDIPTEQMYKLDCNDDATLESYGLNTTSDATKNNTRTAARNKCTSEKYPKFHHWLNAPHPVYRENIKSIKFLDSRPATSASSDTKAGKFCWDVSERQTGQVMACATRRDNVKVKISDIDGLLAVDVAADVVQEISNTIAEGVNTLKCTAQWIASIFAGDEEACSDEDWTPDEVIMMSLPQPLYDIEIGQDGGVNAPINSSNLFYYVGQNTDYILDGRFMVPRENAKAWYKVYTSDFMEGDDVNAVIAMGGPIIGTSAYTAGRFVTLLGETFDNVAIQTKICAQSRYYAYGPRLELKDYGIKPSCDSNVDSPTTINTKNFIVKNVVNMQSMFEGAKFNHLQWTDSDDEDDRYTYGLDETFLSDTGKVTNMSRMFANTTDMSSWGVGSSDHTLNTSSVKDFSGMFAGSRFGMCDYDYDSAQQDKDKCKYDKEKAYDGGKCTSSKRDKCGINISKFDTSKATNMSNMFANAHAAHNIVVDDIDTQHVTDMSWMFASTTNNTELDLSGFDTANVTNMAGMFSGTGLKSLDVSNFNTANVTDMSRMFENLYIKKGAELDLKNFDTSKVVTMEGMFSGSNVLALNLGNFDTSRVRIMKDMFFSLGEDTEVVDVSSFNTENVTDMSWMFANVTPVPADDTSDGTCDLGTDLSASAAIKKTSLILVPVSNARLEEQTPKLELALGALVGSIFGLELDVECRVNDINETDIKNIKISDYAKLPEAKYSRASLDLRSFNTSKVTTMEGMFAGSKANVVNFTPSTEPGVDFDTSKVTDMSWMFAGIGYSAITYMPLDTSGAQKLVGMFAGLSIDSTGDGLDISTMVVPENNSPDVSWMFTSSCIAKGKDGITFSDSMKKYIDSLPKDDSDQKNKKKFIFDDMATCGS